MKPRKMKRRRGEDKIDFMYPIISLKKGKKTKSNIDKKNNSTTSPYADKPKVLEL